MYLPLNILAMCLADPLAIDQGQSAPAPRSKGAADGAADIVVEATDPAVDLLDAGDAMARYLSDGYRFDPTAARLIDDWNAAADRAIDAGGA